MRNAPLLARLLALLSITPFAADGEYPWWQRLALSLLYLPLKALAGTLIFTAAVWAKLTRHKGHKP